MSFLDKAKAMISKDPQKMVDGIDKATDMIDDKTGGKYTEQLDKVDETVADKLGGADTEDEGTEPSA